MERAKIFLAEDDLRFSDQLQKLLKEVGHEIVELATNLGSADLFVQNLRPGIIDVAIIDGNLSPQSRFCQDGQRLSAQTKLIDPTVFVVAYTASDQPGYGDVVLDKTDYDAPARLLKAIHSL